MKKITTLAFIAISGLLAPFSASAIVTHFDLLGKGGAGLLASNENGVVNGNFGSGGEIGSGITFDDASNLLTINVGWGTANGFTDLTGNASMGHIHGPTPSAAPAAFNENVGVLIGLDSLVGWNNSASAGGFSGTVSVPAQNVADLFNGKLYINIHTSTNAGGEIRGNLVAVPEPSTYALLGAVALLGLAYIRRRK